MSCNCGKTASVRKPSTNKFKFNTLQKNNTKNALNVRRVIKRPAR